MPRADRRTLRSVQARSKVGCARMSGRKHGSPVLRQSLATVSHKGSLAYVAFMTKLIETFAMTAKTCFSASSASGAAFKVIRPLDAPPVNKTLLAAPSTEEIAAMLRRHWPVDEATSLRIAVGSGGCVRAALADLESWLDAEGLS